MTDIKEGAGLVVASDVRSAMAAVDDALLQGARMYVSVLETAQSSTLPVSQTQKLFASLTSGLNSVVTGRAEMVSAVRQMTVIKKQSNLAPLNFGCPDGWETMAQATAVQSEPAVMPS